MCSATTIGYMRRIVGLELEFYMCENFHKCYNLQGHCAFPYHAPDCSAIGRETVCHLSVLRRRRTATDGLLARRLLLLRRLGIYTDVAYVDFLNANRSLAPEGSKRP